MFRLSTLLLATASAEEFCLDEASSLIQEAKKPVKTNRRDPKPLAGLLESARGFLTNGATPDVINFTQTALDEVANSIIPTLESESLADKAWMDTELARFGDALNELTVSNTAVHQWNAEEVQASADHKACRRTESEACTEKRNCEMRLYSLWLEWVREETELREIHTQLENHFCVQDEHGNYIANGTQHSFRVASVPWMTSYTEQKGACELAEGAYDEQIPHCVVAHGELDHWSAECNAKLEDLEGKACAHASAIAENLRLFHAAWASLHASYQGITDLVYNQTQDRHKEYKVLVVVQCLLNRVTEYNGRPCDETTGTVDDNMAHCEEQGETLTICAQRPALCPTFDPPPATPPYCADRSSVVGPCLPDPTPRPCTQAWEDAEMTEGEQPWQLPVLPDPTFTETNPGCNEYPDCSVCSGADAMYETRETAAQQLAGYHEWVEPPASFALATATRSYNDAAEDYASRHFGASVDGCSSDNSNGDASRGDQSGQAIPLVAHIVDDTAAVRCCSQDGSSCISQVHGVCYDTATFHEAISICRSAGMRLCSEAEMGTGVCCGTGCWFNHYASWVSDALAESALAEQNRPEWTVVKGGNGSPHAGVDVGSATFNAMFSACPVVRYTNPSMAGSPGVYKRHASAGAYPGDALDLFAGTWRKANNLFHTDFDIYPTAEDARAGTNAWTFCNFADEPQPNHVGVGFPRDCGPTGYQPHIWFSQGRNAYFEIYTGNDCPTYAD